MTTKINRSTAEFIRDEDTGQALIRIGAQSYFKPELRATNDILPGTPTTNNFRDLMKMVGIAGAACAEYLGERYGEAMDPGQCELDSKQAFTVECQRLNELQAGVGEKLKLAKQRCWLMTNDHVEMIRRLDELYGRRGMILPVEVAYLDKVINSVFDA
jgi:hypothetical protein